MSSRPRVALVTGANRGIGLAVARQLAADGMAVVLGARDLKRGQAAARPLVGRGLDVHAHQLDVTDGDSAARLTAWVERTFGRLDVLVNNAGIYPGGRASTIGLEVVRRALEVNAIGPWRLCIAALPLMRRRRYGRIVNVSSEAGSLTSMGADTPAYNVSKAALNAITRVLAADLQGTGILVNAVCPGWVRTDMGGPDAPRSPEEAAAGIVWAATLPAGGPTGQCFRDRKPLPW